MADILLVDRNEETRAALALALGSEHHLEWAKNLNELDLRVAHGLSIPDLVLVDIDQLEGEDPMELTSHRFANSKLGVILLSGTDTVAARIRSFELGALDFVPKPFDFSELSARVKARIKMHNRNVSVVRAPLIRNLGSISIDLERQMAFEDHLGEKRPLALTPFELRLLILLTEAKGEPVPRDAILARVWGGSVVSARCVDHHVCGLRKKIMPSGYRIESVYGVGYRLSNT